MKKGSPAMMLRGFLHKVVKYISSTSGMEAGAATKMFLGMYVVKYHNSLKIKNPSAGLKDTQMQAVSLFSLSVSYNGIYVYVSSFCCKVE
jgi:hypothetical protein